MGEVIGPGKALDSDRYQVLGIDFLGGSGATTGPRAGQTNFPSISTYDQADILRRVVEHLGLAACCDRRRVVRRHGRAGVRRAFRNALNVCRDQRRDRAHPMATAWRSVQRAMVRYARRTAKGREGCGSRVRWRWRPIAAPRSSQRDSAARRRGSMAVSSFRSSVPAGARRRLRRDVRAGSVRVPVRVHRSAQVDAARIRVPATLVGDLEDQLVPIADLRLCARAWADAHSWSSSRRSTVTMRS